MIDDLLPIAARIAARLLERGETVAIADGATGGLLSAALIAVPGATRFYPGGGVVYSLHGREVLLGLTREELRGMRSVTEDYALAQARAIRSRFAADWGLAETGSAGPGKHPRGPDAGTSAFAVAGTDGEFCMSMATGSENRLANMIAFAAGALTLLETALRGSGP